MPLTAADLARLAALHATAGVLDAPDTFFGPCAHERDPYTRCDSCCALTAAEARRLALAVQALDALPALLADLDSARQEATGLRSELAEARAALAAEDAAAGVIPAEEAPPPPAAGEARFRVRKTGEEVVASGDPAFEEWRWIVPVASTAPGMVGTGRVLASALVPLNAAAEAYLRRVPVGPPGEPLFRTAGGVAVVPDGPAVRDGGAWRMACRRADTGGWHGNLVVGRLGPLNAEARQLVDRLARADLAGNARPEHGEWWMANGAESAEEVVGVDGPEAVLRDARWGGVRRVALDQMADPVRWSRVASFPPGSGGGRE